LSGSLSNELKLLSFNKKAITKWLGCTESHRILPRVRGVLYY